MVDEPLGVEFVLLEEHQGAVRVGFDERIARVRRVVRIPHGLVYTGPMVHHRDAFMVITDGTAYAVPIDGGPPIELGPASFAVPGATDDRVWLVTGNGEPKTVQEVDYLGNELIPFTSVPADHSPLHGALDGIILHPIYDSPSEGGPLMLWDPVSGRIRRATEPGGCFIAVHKHVLAWGAPTDADHPCSALHLTDLVTGEDRLITILDDIPGRPALAEGLFSPDGRVLALVVRDLVIPGRRLYKSNVVLIEVTTGARTVLDVGGFASPMAWSPSGEWLFFGRSGEWFNNPELLAYKLADETPKKVPLDLTSVVGLIIR